MKKIYKEMNSILIINMTKLQTRVVIHPFNLSGNIHKLISNYIERECCRTLSKDGYVKSVNSVSKISGGRITSSSNGSVVYDVEYDANVYKLEKGDTIKAIIKSITTFGVYCDDWDAPDGVAIFFIPKHELEEDEELKDNDILFLKIEDLRIKKNEYLCVCSKSSSECYSSS